MNFAPKPKKNTSDNALCSLFFNFQMKDDRKEEKNHEKNEFLFSLFYLTRFYDFLLSSFHQFLIKQKTKLNVKKFKIYRKFEEWIADKRK